MLIVDQPVGAIRRRGSLASAWRLWSAFSCWRIAATTEDITLKRTGVFELGSVALRSLLLPVLEPSGTSARLLPKGFGGAASLFRVSSAGMNVISSCIFEECEQKSAR